MELDDREVYSGNFSLKVTIESIDETAWHFKVRQKGLSFEGGKKHTIKFWAKAEVPRDVEVCLQRNYEPWKVLFWQNISLTENWQEFVIEVMDQNQVEVLAPVADVYQVGARSMASTSLLKKLAKIDRPVLLKRNCASTLGEFLAAAEYLVSGGNERVILCERGVRSFDNWMRFSLDIPGIALLRQVCHLPVIADISLSLGRVDLAGPVAAAALAAGANGLMMEVHASPNRALSDASQQLTPRQFSSLLGHLKINLKKRPKR